MPKKKKKKTFPPVSLKNLIHAICFILVFISLLLFINYLRIVNIYNLLYLA